MTSPGRGRGLIHAPGGVSYPGSPYPRTARPPLRLEWPSEPDRPGEPVRLRDRWCFLVVFVISLLALAGTDTGRMIFDTKLGVDIDPAGFLARLWPLWNPLEWLGTLQNQYIGYAIPMAPFFLLGQLAHVPVWMVERTWLALLVTVGFAGLVKLARALEVGTDGTRLLAGAVFVLGPTFTIVIGSTSAAALPGLVVPWTILPLVAATSGRRAGRAVALSGLSVAAMGGVNAASTGYVLVLPALFILLRATGRARLSLLARWAAAVLAGMAWWLVPLLLQGRYSFNFLPYIEQSATTFQTMSAAAFLRGAGAWTAYVNLGTPWLSAGWSDVTSPAAILASAVAAGTGLYGLARRDMPARRWLLASTGVACVVALAGYWGPLGGPVSGLADALFNGPLAPLRSAYKIEPAVALPLALGCAHAVSRWTRGTLPRRAGRVPMSMAITPLAALTLAGLAVAQLSGNVLQPGSFSQVPAYWTQVAGYLAAHSPRQAALVVPADSHGLYLWGDPIDDPLEPLASSPWAERALVPYGGAGSQVFLDTAEQALESGQAVPGLTVYLARAGVRYVVLRADLNPGMLGYVSPQLVSQTLARSGFERVASFGPLIPSSASYPPTEQPQPPGPAPSYPAVQVFQAASPAWRPASPVTALPAASTVLVNGGPDSLLPLAGQGVVTSQPAVIAGDPLPVRPSLWAVTDGQRRAATAFGLTTQNVSYTYTATETNPPDTPLAGAGGPPRQLLPVPAAGHQTVAALSGAARVTASSYGSWLTEEPQYDPVNAFDGNPATAWTEGDAYTPVGQWIQVTFDHALDLPGVIGVQLLVDTPAREVASTVRVSTAAGQVTTTLAGTGARQPLRVPPGATTWLRVTITGASSVVPGGLGAGFTGVLIPGVRVTRYLQPAEDLAGTQAASTVYSFQQDPSATAGVLARTFQVPAGQQVSMTASAAATPGAALSRLLASLAAGGPSTFRVTASSAWGSLPRYSPDNLFSQAGTPWIASQNDPSPLLRVTWQGARTISEIVLRPAAGTAFPASVAIVSPQGTRVANVGQGGVVRLVPPLRTTSLYVLFPGALSLSPSTSGGLPAGLSRLTIPGLAGLHVAAPASGATFRLACGQGPMVSVDGTSYVTAVTGTVADLIQSRPVQVQLCTPGGQLTLSAGQHWLLATPSGAFAITDLDLRTPPAASGTAIPPALAAPGAASTGAASTGAASTGAASTGAASTAAASTAAASTGAASTGAAATGAAATGAASTAAASTGAASTGAASTGAASTGAASRASVTGRRPVQVLTWQADRRSLRIGPGAESYVEVHENFNDGWTATLNGRPLAAVRLDGWQQAFVVPAGQGGIITLAYAPAAVYHAGLIASALALAILAVLATGAGRRRGRRRPAAGPGRAPHAGRTAGLSQLPDAGDPPAAGRAQGRPGRRDGPRWPGTGLLLVLLAVVIWLAGGPMVLAVPVLAVLGRWRPRWLPWVAFGAMLVAGVTAAAGSPTAVGSGTSSGLAQAAALVALTAALMPAAITTRAGDSGRAAA